METQLIKVKHICIDFEMILISLTFFSFFFQLCLSAISGATSKCGLNSDPMACGRASVLRGQSHIGIPAACFSKVDPGPCTEDLVRIYYDAKTFTCKSFSFSGCGGNANRFVSIKNCYKLCHPYYRQRFLSLDPADPNAKPLPPFKEEVTTTEKTTDPKKKKEKETTEGGTGTEGEETTTLDPKDPNANIRTIDRKKEEKPEIQVVHEYDSFLTPNTRSMPVPGQPGQPGQATNYGAESNFGNLQNIQSENYKPMAGYLPTSDGYREQPIGNSKVFYTQFK